MARIRVMIVDDHYLMRVGLANVLGFEPDIEVCAQAESGDEALAQHRLHRPDVTLMDLRMAGTDGLATLVLLRRECPGARVIILSDYTGVDEIHAALQGGAASYLPKTVGQPELLKAIRQVADGRTYVPPDLAVRLAERLLCEELTFRERQVLALVVEGASNANIARKLGIADSTVKSHISNIFEKLGVTQRTEAVAVAIKRGIVRIE
ncbi:MAG: response regulator transcription factor [Vicinamibacteria bacterium]|nr:response regulator transcription factor [Vicinamibacteria bacterium]